MTLMTLLAHGFLAHGFPGWLKELIGTTVRNGLIEQPLHWGAAGLDYARTYKGKVAVASPYGAESEIFKLCEILEANGIRINFSGRTLYDQHLDTFTIVMWRPEDEDIAYEFIRQLPSKRALVRV